MRTKEEIYADMAPLREELDAIELKERKVEHAKLLGKCFKYRNNYGGDCAGWWLYGRVYGSEGYSPLAFTFETTAHDIIEIKPMDRHPSIGRPNSNWQEIPAKEFNAAWRALQRRLAKVQFK